MRITSLLTLVATTATTTTALYLPSWNHQNEEIPSLSAQQWQEVKALGYDQVTQGIKMADDFIGRIVDDVEHRTHNDLKGDDSQKTIWQLLNQDSDRYSKLLKAIEIEGGHAKDVLDDRESSITFFAPENSGIPNPPHHRDEDHSSLSASMDTLVKNPSLDTLLHVHSLHGQTLFGGEHDHDDDKDKERKKRIFKFILGEILKYHGLPQAVTAGELANNKTVATALIPKFGANDGEPLRLRVEKNLVPPSLELNFYAKVIATHSDRKAINGYLHEIDHPLLPPPSVLDSVFFSRDFDTFTTAIQKIGGAGAVAWEFSGRLSKEQHHPVFVGAPAITAFVPTTDAFKKLPKKLQFFLFSPFGEDVLRKILQFHIIPTHTVFTEAVHTVGKKHEHDHGGHKHGHHEHEHEKKSWLEDEVEALMMLASTDGDDTIHLDETFPTLLENATLRVVIDKARPLPIPGTSKITLTVNDVEAEVIDIPALNGVFHVLPEVLKPPHKHHDEEGDLVESEWNNWEQWLVQWAAAN